MQTLPSLVVEATVRLATVVPALKFRVDAVGRDWSHGYTVTNPGAVALVTVMFNTAARMAGGTPTRPPIGTSSTESAGRGPIPCSTWSAVCRPGRVSTIRTGCRKRATD